MLSNIETVRAYYVALDRGDLEKAGQYLSDDFRQYTTRPSYMTKSEVLHVLRHLLAAMPDFKHVLSNMESQGPVVKVTVQAGGRHTGPLDLTDVGLGFSEGVVPSSGRMIIFLANNLEYTVVNEKITAEHNVTPQNAMSGKPAFLQAFGYTE